MWFVRLTKLKHPPSKESMAHVNAQRAEAEMWGVKVHHTFFTLGRYDVVSIIEAPDEKIAMRYGMLLSDGAVSETLTAVSRDEVDSWYK